MDEDAHTTAFAEVNQLFDRPSRRSRYNKDRALCGEGAMFHRIKHQGWHREGARCDFFCEQKEFTDRKEGVCGQ